MLPMRETGIKPARILENLNTSILVLDDELKVKEINPSCEMLFAISVSKARGRHLRDLIVGPAPFLERIESLIRTGHPTTERGLELELSNRRTLMVDYTVTPLDEPGKSLGLLLEFMPVGRSIRISMEENLLSQHNASRALIRGLAHEIKNPLGGLRGAAQLLERELPTAELKEYTQIIIDEADRLQTLVNRLLGPNSLPDKKLVNIHQIIERVRSLVTVEAPPGIRIQRDYDPAIPLLVADADQLIQALLNLLRNSVQALGDEGVIVLRTRTLRQITIGHKRYKLVLNIEIEDNGPGIPEHIQDQIFYPMITGHAEGTGLGLSIAQSLVNRHDGLIECSSEPGCTVFRLLLPLETEHECK